MGLRSFYLAVNCHFFFAGLRPAPRWGPRRPPDPRVRPCSASRSPKRQVRLSAEVTSGRPTSKKTAMSVSGEWSLIVAAAGSSTEQRAQHEQQHTSRINTRAKWLKERTSERNIWAL